MWRERGGGRERDLPPFFPFGWEAGGGGNGVDRERSEGGGGWLNRGANARLRLADFIQPPLLGLVYLIIITKTKG